VQVSPVSQVPLPQFVIPPQSPGQVTAVSAPSQTPSPQSGHAPQSIAQLAQVSLAAQVPSPHVIIAGQSIEQVAFDSVGPQTVSPQKSPPQPTVQSAGHELQFSPISHMPSPHTTVTDRAQAHVSPSTAASAARTPRLPVRMR
jgi:hypothetical protein